jgi:glycosyltransferase involved in cell wall biosynthesis
VTFDVVIPARNEAATIGPIVASFRRHRRIGRVIVALDMDTTDDTAGIAYAAGAVITGGIDSGKGQVVNHALLEVDSQDVIFCDADYRNLSQWHISRICAYKNTHVQLIGAPDIPDNYPPSKEWAWPWVSGFRRVPTILARSVDLHGYLMEVQLNDACRRYGIPTMMTRLIGLVSPYEMTETRTSERDRDFAWGVKNGVLRRPGRRHAPRLGPTGRGHGPEVS